MDGIGTTADIDELASYSNFVFIHSGEMANKLQRCRELGLKAIVSFNWLMFDTNARLFPDWQSRVKWATDIMDQYLDVIIANYIFDEPYANGANQGVSVSDMYNALETVAQFFKARYPEMPLAVIFSTQELNGGSKTYKLMPSFDWIGMDCYGGFFQCDKSSIPGYYNLLKTDIEKLEAVDGKKRYFMAVPPSGWETTQPQNEDGHYNQIVPYRNFIKSESRFKVVIPFVWQSFGTGKDAWTGCRNSAKLKPAYQKFFQDFISGNL